METVRFYIPWSGSESWVMRKSEWLGEQGTVPPSRALFPPLVRKKAKLSVISNFLFYIISPCRGASLVNSQYSFAIPSPHERSQQYAKIQLKILWLNMFILKSVPLPLPGESKPSIQKEQLHNSEMLRIIGSGW